jgi:carbon monoxide dehydrogenase subunit G
MRYEGSVTINAPMDKVFANMTDPNLVSQCAPGLKSMEIVEPDKLFKVVAGIGFGAVNVTFDVNVEWMENRPPDFAKVKAHGSGQGSAVDVISEMHLTTNPDNTTVLDWTADISIVGAIAGLASRMMGGIIKKLSGSFFECIREKIEESVHAQA